MTLTASNNALPPIAKLPCGFSEAELYRDQSNGELNRATQIGAMREFMSESNHRKSALASAVSYPARQVTALGFRCVALYAVLLFANLPAIAVAQSSYPGIHVKILGIRSSTGTVDCALFDSQEGFPSAFLKHATNIVIMKVRDMQARCDFLNIRPGTYALAVIHDEDMDGKLDTNWMGVPKEGYGFSNNAKASLSAPPFDDASFRYDGEKLDLTIRLNY